MRSLFQLAAFAAALVGYAAAVPVQVVHPGGVNSLIITAQDTINGTSHPNATSSNSIHGIQSTQQLPFTFVNNYGSDINAYVTGLDSNNKVVLLQPDGTFYYPSGAPSVPAPIDANVAIPVAQGATVNIKLPGFISSSRVWFAAGELQFFIVADGNGNPGLVQPSATNPADPSANVNWGFVELTNNDSGIYANISYVDFVGLILGMTLTGGDGSTQNVPGLQRGAVDSVCNDLKAQAAADGQPWDQLCMVDSSGNPIRVLSPNDYISVNSGAWSGYYDDYINQVWSKYTSSPLTIDTQTDAGNVACQVSGDTLNCAGDNRGYAKPTVADIWGCNSGPFGILGGDNAIHLAVVPRLCAAFDRTTLLLDGGNVQPSLPPSSYYPSAPTNWFSQIVHKYEIDNIGYAFSYDDVGPDGAPPQSGLVSDPNPQLLTIVVGGPSS